MSKGKDTVEEVTAVVETVAEQEENETTAVAVQQPRQVGAEFTTVDGVVLKLKKLVTKPNLSWDVEPGTTYVVTVLTKIYQSAKEVVVKRKKVVDGKSVEDGSFKSKADMIDVRDLRDGVEKTMVLPAVLKGALTDNYPDDSYVGLSFAIQLSPEGKGERSYKRFNIGELE